MSKGRRLLIALIVLAVVLAVGAVAMKMLFPADKLAAMAVERVREETGANVTYGDVNLDLWPRVGLTISDLVLDLDGADLAAAQGTEAGPLATLVVAVRHATGGLAWGPLLKKRVELDRLLLEGPDVTVITRAAGAAATTVESGGGETPPVAVIMAGVSVHDGSLRWSEEGSGRTVTITDWNQDATLDDVALLGRRLAAFGAGTPLPETAGEPSRIGLAGDVGTVELTGFQPEVTMTLADVGLKAVGLIGPAADVFELSDVELNWGETRVVGHGSVRGEGGGFRLDLQWLLKDLDAAALQKALPGLTTAVPEPWSSWLGDAPVAVDGFDASGTYTALLPPSADAVPADHLRGLDAAVTLKSAVFTPPDRVDPWHAAAVASIDDGALTVTESRIEIGTGHLTGTMTMAPLGAPDAAVTLNAMMRDLPTKIVLETIVPSAAPYLEGGLDGEVVGGFTLGEPEALRSSLTLDGEGILQEGVVHASSWLEGISRYLGDRQDLKEIRFHSLSHLLKVRDGKYLIDDLKLVGHDTDWVGDGFIGLDGSIDLGLNVKFPRDFHPNLGAMTALAESLRGEDGRMVLDLQMTGRAARPAVSVDLTSAQNRLQDAVSGGVQGWLDKLRRKD